MDLQALASLGLTPPVLGAAAGALVLAVAAFVVLRIVRQAGLRKRHPGLLAKYHNAPSYKKLAAAEAAEKAGQHEAAGDLYAAVQLSAPARQAYAKAQAYEKLANLQLGEGQRNEAAQSLEKAGLHTRARDVYIEAGKLKEAARAAKLAGDLPGAAALYKQAGEHAMAADLYRVTGEVDKAVEALESSGDALAAARLGVQRVNEHMRAIREGKATSPAKEKEIQQLAARIAGPLAGSSDPAEWEQALQLQLFVRNFGEAAELYRRLGKKDKAVEFFLRAGQRRKAADVLDELGNPRESARLKGEDFVERNMLREAVAQFETAFEWDRAAELLVKLGDNLKAALHYQRMEHWERAAELFEADGKYAEAADCYRKAQLNDRALACFEKLQDWGAYNELLESLERWYEAGVSYIKRGLTDKAIKSLQKVDEAHPQYRDAALRLGDLFQQKGMFGLAKEKYLSILGQERINRSNLETFYSLAEAYEANGEITQSMQTFEKILGFDFHYKDVGQRISDLKTRISARTTPAPGVPAGAVDPFAQTMVNPVAQKRRYEIIKELGRGGMGVVYKARDTVLDRIVALKVLPPMFRQNEVALRNFFREAKSAAGLSHPNIVTVFDTGEEAGNAYIAMEFVEGQDLKQIVQESGPLPIGPVVLIFGQMCQALAYAHEAGIVHRDIKPSNVLWTKTKQCKITDFGLARALSQGANTLTTTGGTPYYMSPEQTLGNTLDHRTDLYSLGVMMYELATGALPFTEGDVGYHHVHTPPPDPRTKNPKLPPALAAMIMRMLAKKPEDRYPDATSIFDELRRSFSPS